MDLTNREVKKDGKPIQLSFKEFELLKYLALRRGRTVSRDELLEEIWGVDVEAGVTTRTVDTHHREHPGQARRRRVGPAVHRDRPQGGIQVRRIMGSRRRAVRSSPRPEAVASAPSRIDRFAPALGVVASSRSCGWCVARHSARRWPTTTRSSGASASSTRSIRSTRWARRSTGARSAGRSTSRSSGHGSSAPRGSSRSSRPPACSSSSPSPTAWPAARSRAPRSRRPRSRSSR